MHNLGAYYFGIISLAEKRSLSTNQSILKARELERVSRRNCAKLANVINQFFMDMIWLLLVLLL